MKSVVHIITGLGNGGAEGALFRLVANDKKIKHTVFSLTPGGKFYGKLKDIGVDVYTIEHSSVLALVRGLFLLKKIIKKHDADVLQSWMYHADLYAAFFSIFWRYKNVFWSIRNSTLNKGSTPFSTRVVVKLCAFLSSFVPNKIICCSEKAKIVHVDSGYRENLFKIVPNGYNFDVLGFDPDKRASFRRSLSINNNSFVVGNVARWHPQKDHKTLIGAFAKFIGNEPNALLVLVGKGMTRENEILMKEIRSQNLESLVFLLGEIDDIQSVMSGIDLHVLSSSFGEAFPNVVVEAMACEVPVVVTDVGDSALIVGGYGIVVEHSNENLLNNAIRSMYSCFKNESEWSLLKKNSKKRVLENFAINKMANSLHDVWFSS